MNYLETIAIIIFLLLPPLILWKCRSFNEKHPSTVAFRSVPLGCLTMFILIAFLLYPLVFKIYDWLKINPPHWLDMVWAPIALLLSVAAGIAVMVVLSKYFAQGRKLPSIILYVCIFILNLFICCDISLVCEQPLLSTASGTWKTIHLPGPDTCHIAFEQHPTHPFLAEYDYRIKLTVNDETRTFMLWPNTGGRTFINVYQLSDGKLWLRDKDFNQKDNNYLIDIAQQTVYLLETKLSRQAETIYAVPLSDKTFHSMGGSSKDFSIYSDEMVRTHSIPLEIDSTNCTYLGCLMDHSFYTPEEQSEGEGHPRYRQSPQAQATTNEDKN